MKFKLYFCKTNISLAIGHCPKYYFIYNTLMKIFNQIHSFFWITEVFTDVTKVILGQCNFRTQGALRFITMMLSFYCIQRFRDFYILIFRETLILVEEYSDNARQCKQCIGNLEHVINTFILPPLGWNCKLHVYINRG